MNSNNRAKGVVVAILYEDGCAPPALPSCVIVQMHRFPDGAESCLPNIERCVPLFPHTASWDSATGKRFQRTQIPLQLAFAITIHKSQGQTLERAIVDVGRDENCLGLFLVALSRVRKLEDLLLHPFSFDRLLKVNDKKGLQKLKAEIQRMSDLDITAVPE